MRAPIIKYFSKIKGLYEVNLDCFKDDRGCNFESYSKDLYESLGFPKISFETDSFSRSCHGVIRGFHGDFVNYKLVSCLYGEVQFFAIDRRHNSPTFDNVLEFNFGENNLKQILLPPGVVNAHCCLSPTSLFSYKYSVGYAPIDKQIHVKYNDPKYSLKWKIANPVLSERDK
jgi:dTDP-4-dehydrorhamnose 3,5-epimerase